MEQIHQRVRIVGLWVLTPCGLAGECFRHFQGSSRKLRQHNPEHHNLNIHNTENLKVYALKACFEKEIVQIYTAEGRGAVS
jgi:hypothetical protein